MGGRLVVQVRPGVLDFFQLAETVRAEGVYGAPVTSLGRIRAELPVELRPRDAERAREVERPIDEPQIQVEAERRPLETLEDVQVERDRVGDDFMKELLAELDFALP